jgi:hypothetical protein
MPLFPPGGPAPPGMPLLPPGGPELDGKPATFSAPAPPIPQTAENSGSSSPPPATLPPSQPEPNLAPYPELKPGTRLVWSNVNFSPEEVRARASRYAFKPEHLTIRGSETSENPEMKGKKRARAGDFL